MSQHMAWQHSQGQGMMARQGRAQNFKDRAGDFGTQCSTIHRGCVPTARGCEAKWDAVSMLKYALSLAQ